MKKGWLIDYDALSSLVTLYDVMNKLEKIHSKF